MLENFMNGLAHFLSHLKLASQNSNKQFWETSEPFHQRMYDFCLLAFPLIFEPINVHCLLFMP